MARFQFFSPDRQPTDDRRLTDKTDCLTPLRACARGVINIVTHSDITRGMQDIVGRA